jgi:hypothetical protein
MSRAINTVIQAIHRNFLLFTFMACPYRAKAADRRVPWRYRESDFSTIRGPCSLRCYVIPRYPAVAGWIVPCGADAGEVSPASPRSTRLAEGVRGRSPCVCGGRWRGRRRGRPAGYSPNQESLKKLVPPKSVFRFRCFRCMSRLAPRSPSRSRWHGLGATPPEGTGGRVCSATTSLTALKGHP